ncbi:MAG: DNA polymerase Y family protein, partial [Phenylobacterium sp.]|nr:DNA polymerase Y family protein [Phenylobacterium sp.]
MSRILCVWSPNWAIETWRRRRPSAPRAEPFALVRQDRGLRVLAAVSPDAAAAGLFPGQRVTDAQALRPDLVLAEAEPEADARALEALADWCVRFSPAVAPDPPDG